MIVVELEIYQDTKVFVPHSPFVYKSIEGAHTTSDYWTTTFGATGDSSVQIIQVNSVIIQPSTYLSKQSSITLCQNTIQSFYFDETAQTLYVHVPHNIDIFQNTVRAGVSINGTNGDVVLIGGFQYDPIVRQVPNVTQKQDYIKYNTLSFLSGNIVFSNVGGEFDDIITSPIYGNEIRQYYLPNGKLDYLRSELVPIASYFVEDFDFSLSEFTINVQDKRKSGNANILSNADFSAGSGSIENVPLVYGQVRALECLVDEEEGTTGSVNFRAAVVLTALGTIQYWNDSNKTWNTVTAASSDLPNGRFVLTAANGREGGVSGGTPRKVRLLEPTGITPAKPSDVIKDLNLRTIGTAYNSTNYDTAEWEAEETGFTSIGVCFDSQMKLIEAIKKVQEGSYPGFRYEIAADGRRTIRINDWTRAVSKNISWFDIKDNMTLKVTTDYTSYFASVKVKYDRDFNEGKFKSVRNTTYQTDSFNKYRQKPEIEIESYQVSSTDANALALWWAERLHLIRGVVNITLHGQEYYSTRIYDILNIELCTENRAYFGSWKAQVLSVAPKFNELSTTITAVLIEKLEC